MHHLLAADSCLSQALYLTSVVVAELMNNAQQQQQQQQRDQRREVRGEEEQEEGRSAHLQVSQLVSQLVSYSERRSGGCQAGSTTSLCTTPSAGSR